MPSRNTKFSSIILMVLAIGFWALPWRALYAQSVHEITVSWVAPSPVGGSGTIAGYNVYRSTTSGGPYTKLNTSTINATSFEDTTGAAGTTYYYVATTIDSNGFESSDSIQASATAVGNPQPPTGVQAVAK